MQRPCTPPIKSKVDWGCINQPLLSYIWPSSKRIQITCGKQPNLRLISPGPTCNPEETRGPQEPMAHCYRNLCYLNKKMNIICRKKKSNKQRNSKNRSSPSRVIKVYESILSEAHLPHPETQGALTVLGRGSWSKMRASKIMCNGT